MWNDQGLKLEQIDGGTRFRLLTQVEFVGSTGAVYAVPAGYETDLASIPRLFQPVLPKLGRWNRAAVLHDALWQISKHHKRGQLHVIRELNPGSGIRARYYTWHELEDQDLRFPSHMLIDPVDVDGLFRRAMRADGVKWPVRWTMWAAVRIAAILTGRVGSMRLIQWAQLATVIAVWSIVVALTIAGVGSVFVAVEDADLVGITGTVYPNLAYI